MRRRVKDFEPREDVSDLCSERILLAAILRMICGGGAGGGQGQRQGDQLGVLHNSSLREEGDFSLAMGMMRSGNEGMRHSQGTAWS